MRFGSRATPGPAMHEKLMCTPTSPTSLVLPKRTWSLEWSWIRTQHHYVGPSGSPLEPSINPDGGGPAKPSMVLHYNQTRGGVDNLDKVAGTYSCRRKTSRWFSTTWWTWWPTTCWSSGGRSTRTGCQANSTNEGCFSSIWAKRSVS